MVFKASFPKDHAQYEQFVTYLQHGTIPVHLPAKYHWGFKKKMENWELNNGLLFLREKDKPARRFVPQWDKEFRSSLFRQFHGEDRHISANDCFDKIMAHHVGITRNEVREFVRSCPACNRTTSIKERDDLTPVVSHGPMEHLQMDLIDFTAYKEQNNGIAWLLTIVCIFSKFLWAIPIADKRAETVGKALAKLFSQWGPPNILQSDNGKEFTAGVIDHICQALGIEVRHSRPRHPMSQGQIERLNQTVGRGFTKMMWSEEEKLQHVNWVDHLDKFIFSYNTTRHSAHGKTPREVLFGHKLLGIYRHVDTNRQDLQEEEVEPLNADTLARDVEDHLKKVSRVHDEVNSQLGRTRGYMLKHASVHRRTTLFEPGQIVALAPDTDMNPATRKRKLQPNFKETGVVVNMTNNNRTVVVQDSDGRQSRWPVKRARVLNGKATFCLKTKTIPLSYSLTPTT
jgi:transposase InsO family protein